MFFMVTADLVAVEGVQWVTLRPTLVHPWPISIRNAP